MAAFSSFQQHIDASSSPSFFLPNNTSSLSSSPSSTMNNMCAHFYQHNLHHGTTPPLSINKNNDSPILNASNSSLSVVTHKYNQTNQENLTPLSKNKRKSKEGSCPNSAQSKYMREGKRKKQKKVIAGEEAPTEFIHVRARRGQATDSHSLAERRERIRERMKLLQALVPGCDKVTGKALMLDEIINYVQSLQNQVEFLSMKLASVNPIFYDFGMDLDSFMVRPDQNFNSMASPLPECNPTTAHVLDNSVNPPLLLQIQSQIPNALPQGDDRGQVLWEEVDEQRQKNIILINQESTIAATCFPSP